MHTTFSYKSLEAYFENCSMDWYTLKKNAVLITIELVLYLFSIELVVYLYKFVSAIISEYYIISDLRHNLLLMLERLKYRWYICCCLAASAWIERCPSIHYSKQFSKSMSGCAPHCHIRNERVYSEQRESERLMKWQTESVTERLKATYKDSSGRAHYRKWIANRAWKTSVHSWWKKIVNVEREISQPIKSNIFPFRTLY